MVMMIRNSDGTVTMGPLDAIVILRHAETDRFHVCLLEEAIPPGPVKDVADMTSVRLKSRMHHTAGSESLDGALQHLREMREKLLIPDSNVLLERALFWDGTAGFVLLLANWRAKEGGHIADVMPCEERREGSPGVPAREEPRAAC